ncbi:MucR family transcriptional regulator [Roseibium sediminicola]|uniref:MucR family transcriptional regulator n=1 Tax=Roseibium sediminicola TaxID=2933272 RepID=A0ABT0H1R4_9HYPH|nr:MucR family transcriptional regulator [Roseibium sp. CAU 1639]MCK7615013.1 MucR family transcriptional regulator [Roseibium sp. CAU 1639]
MSAIPQSDVSLGPDFVDLTADIVSAYVSNNTVASSDLPALISSVHSALSSTAQNASEPAIEELKPAVPIKKSVTDQHIICLEDGKKFKSLKRHLRTHFGMTPEEYRTKWNLPADYPMVAPGYAAARSELAKKMGLGQNGARKARKPRSKT